MLGGKELQLRLHQRQWCAQLVGGVAGKLPLRGKGIVQPLQHLVEGAAELPELRQHVLVDLHIREIVQLHLLHLRGKAAQRLERAAADEIRQNAAQHRHRCRDIPVRCAEGRLRAVYDNGHILVHSGKLRIEKRRIAFHGGAAVILNEAANGVHIVQPGGAEQQLHGNAGRADEQHGQQRDAPLQRKPLHASSPPIRYPSPMRLRMGSQPSAARSFLRRAEICTRMELLKLSTLLSQT